MIDLRPLVPSGSGVWWGQGGAEPTPLVDALLDQVEEIGDVRAFCGLTWNERLAGDLPPGLTVQSYGGLGELDGSTGRGRSTSSPATTRSCRGCSSGVELPHDVGLVQVSPPDDHGLVSLGIGVEYVADAIAHTKVLVAEINHRMPGPTAPRGSRWTPSPPPSRPNGRCGRP